MANKHRLKYKQYVGEKFNRLTILEVLESQKSGVGVKLKCRCDCGKITTPSARSVVNLYTKSCGCILSENVKKRFPSIKERLNNYIDKSSGRWIWIGYKNSGGYGRICFNRKMVLVHRLIYELYIGEISEGMLICHRNDIPEDVTPSNLFQGTHKDNNHDMIKKGRNVILMGNDSPNSKLSEAKVRSIRILHEAGEYTQNELSELFNVERSTIGYVVQYKNWKHVQAQ
jgi:hypothetical protein